MIGLCLLDTFIKITVEDFMIFDFSWKLLGMDSCRYLALKQVPGLFELTEVNWLMFIVLTSFRFLFSR